MTDLLLPPRLAETCAAAENTRAWLAALPAAVAEVTQRWSLVVGQPYADASCSWVAPCATSSGTPAVLKLGMPHMEARDEAHALRFWDGDAAARLLRHDTASGAMLLERCEPGMSLRGEPEDEQDRVIAALLRRLWREPASAHPFRHLSEMAASWEQEALGDVEDWADPGLTREGIHLMQELAGSGPQQALLSTDLHAGNVLRATRKPWLAIDPKPFVGDTAYDATQHLFNCGDRLRADPNGTIRRFADLLEVDHKRVRLWLFAREAVDLRRDAHGSGSLVRALAP